MVDNCGIRTYLCALTAFNALGFIYMSNVVVVKGNCTTLTHVLTTVGKTSAAGCGNFVTCGRAFIAGDIDNLNNVLVILITAHGDLYTLTENSALLIDTAAHCGVGTGRDDLGYLHDIFKQGIAPRLARYLTQYFIF